jgi:rhodanese-related sulfurtransferase
LTVVEEEDEDEVRYKARGSVSSPNFHWLTDRLAVGGAFPAADSADLAHQHGFSAVVDLRAEDCDDAELLRAAGIDLLHLPTPDLLTASRQHLEQGVVFARERLARGEKVLIHCQHGIGRSALLALCVMVEEGFEPLDALRRAKDRREVVSLSRSQYDGWCAWLESRGIEPPDYHSFGCIAYRHLASG